MTGVGVAALLREAERLGRLDEVARRRCESTITVCRGPKPVAVLRRHDVQVGITAAEPHTTTELLQALDAGRRRGQDGGRSCTTASETKPPRTACARAARPSARSASTNGACLTTSRRSSGSSERSSTAASMRSSSPARFRAGTCFRSPTAIGKTARADRRPQRARSSSRPSARCAPRRCERWASSPTCSRAHPKMGPMMIALADYYELTDRRGPLGPMVRGPFGPTEPSSAAASRS